MKALIAIFSCHALSYGDARACTNTRRDVVRQTWLKTVREMFPEGIGSDGNAVDVRFFLGRKEGGNPGRPAADEIFFNDTPDDYVNGVWKLKRLLRYAQKRDYDFVLKVDDDTFLSREMLDDLFVDPAAMYVGQHY